MANPILEDSALDYTKPFTVEIQYRDENGLKYSVFKETFPLKQSVEYRARVGLPSPWDVTPRISQRRRVSSDDIKFELDSYLKEWKETSERPSRIVPVKVVEAL
jgi:hypothetical protein